MMHPPSGAVSGKPQSRILLVEDETIVALDVSRRLKKLGYGLAGTVGSGEEAVRVAGDLDPDLVLMDIMLSGEMDGIEAASILRERHGLAVVYLTALADGPTLERAKLTEPFGYILKPFEDRELASTIEMALYKSRMDRRLVENERLFSITLKSLGEAVITLGHGGRIRYLNPEAERLLGVSASEVQGERLVEVLHIVNPSRTGAVCRDALGAFGAGVVSADHPILVTRRGDRIPIEKHISPIIDEKGRKQGMVLIFRDISLRRRTEEALRDAVCNMRRALEETVNALAVTSEKRDPYTAGHQQRVSALAGAMAEVMGLSVERREGLRVASLLHDIGKIYVPTEILAKPSLLSPMEMSIVKTHSEVGHEILQNIPFPWPVARMVLEHHERVDGSGYPRGLTSEEVLPESRILAVADVVEAMSSHRPYRAALGVEPALAEIGKHRGTRYDPLAVDACLEVFRDKTFDF